MNTAQFFDRFSNHIATVMVAILWAGAGVLAPLTTYGIYAFLFLFVTIKLRTPFRLLATAQPNPVRTKEDSSYTKSVTMPSLSLDTWNPKWTGLTITGAVIAMKLAIPVWMASWWVIAPFCAVTLVTTLLWNRKSRIRYYAYVNHFLLPWPALFVLWHPGIIALMSSTLFPILFFEGVQLAYGVMAVLYLQQVFTASYTMLIAHTDFIGTVRNIANSRNTLPHLNAQKEISHSRHHLFLGIMKPISPTYLYHEQLGYDPVRFIVHDEVLFQEFQTYERLLGSEAPPTSSPPQLPSFIVIPLLVLQSTWLTLSATTPFIYDILRMPWLVLAIAFAGCAVYLFQYASSPYQETARLMAIKQEKNPEVPVRSRPDQAPLAQDPYLTIVTPLRSAAGAPNNAAAAEVSTESERVMRTELNI